MILRRLAEALRRQDSCYESNASGFQRMFDCPPPVDEETARAVADTLAGNVELMEELRYWMSTMHVAQLIANDRVASATALKEMIATNEAARQSSLNERRGMQGRNDMTQSAISEGAIKCRT